jgi:hypothetical protein
LAVEQAPVVWVALASARQCAAVHDGRSKECSSPHPYESRGGCYA